ncbi:MAG: hypothetical protein GFH27_549307n2 [Chloroflexi bacterium AL-W]|nr:hypothetical protein [Chloroflexi bacterium AL-N1]NOK69034.1 hypothetical protein [Chloroflexi bacterium AL-N10]NOK77017.1 hypothetical protein [Chloroflexi bacterium AL-N5]NOK83662.1 hypothetical protein [Chloroflexi bacterium AL-W]NOK90872.1 hypothetical protein [Chloroflexi bacterium AL-N15]
MNTKHPSPVPSFVDNDPSFGQWLRHQRRQRDLTQAELAHQLGYSEATIRALEAGRRYPSRQLLYCLVKYFCLSGEEEQWLYQHINSQRQRRPVVSVPSGFSNSTLMGHPSALPLSLTPLIGREDLLQHIQQLAQAPEMRLLTLVGPPGVGKTRVALQLAHELQPYYHDGVWWVSLTKLQHPQEVLDLLAHLFGLSVTNPATILIALQHHLQARQLLLMLDNCEHMLDIAPHMMNLLQAVGQLTVVATSRTLLRVPGEQIVSIPPLPPPLITDSPAMILTNPAVQLFLHRANALAVSWEASTNNLTTLAAICRMLDGLPLAIELVAAHSRLYDPAALVRLLQHQLLDLPNPTRCQEVRHASLREALTWSYSLLTPPEQGVFATFGVFRGGATMEAIQTVVGDTDYTTSTYQQCVSGLLDKSFIQGQVDETGSLRLTLLETVRHYARECLVANGNLAQLQQRHVHYYLTLAEQARPALQGPDQQVWFILLEADQPNMREALHTAFTTEAFDLAARLIVALCHFWCIRGYLSEAHQWFTRILNHLSVLAPSQRADVFCQAGIWARVCSNCTAAQNYILEYLTLCRQLDSPNNLTNALMHMGSTLFLQGHYTEARPYLLEALEMARTLQMHHSIAVGLHMLGSIALAETEHELARCLFEEALQLCQNYYFLDVEASVLTLMGEVAICQECYPKARELFQQARQSSQTHLSPLYLAYTFEGEGTAACRQGEYTVAVQCFRSSVTIWRDLMLEAELVQPLHGVAELAVRVGVWTVAVQCLSASVALRERYQVPLYPVERCVSAQLMDRLQQHLPTTTFAVLWAEGSTLTFTEQIALMETFLTHAICDYIIPERSGRNTEGSGRIESSGERLISMPEIHQAAQRLLRTRVGDQHGKEAWEARDVALVRQAVQTGLAQGWSRHAVIQHVWGIYGGRHYRLAQQIVDRLRYADDK